MALSSHHYLANMVDHRFRGVHLTPEEKEQAYALLSEKNEAFLPILMFHCAGAAPFLQYLYTDSLREMAPVIWWQSTEISLHNKNFDWRLLKQGWLKSCSQLLSSNAWISLPSTVTDT